MSDVLIPWRPVTLAPAAIPAEVQAVLHSVDNLKDAWENTIKQMHREEFAEARQRSLRRHAIETGIIERLYDLDWGITEALVAEGISADVVAREGGATDQVLRTITDQLDGLQFVSDLAVGDRPLSSFLVKELHSLITGSQATYEARDQFGRPVFPPLLHGDWKLEPNHVLRPDGSLLQYTPPEQVGSEMDRLVEMYEEQQRKAVHPIVLSAWLHHQFVSIHPFQDGNGRVGRALSLLVLLRHHYAPLVVDRTRRSDYLESLDRANAGDLWVLTRLFAQLEIEALRSELERPSLALPERSQPKRVAQAYVDRVLAARAKEADALRRSTISTANDIQMLVRIWLEGQRTALRSTFQPIDSRPEIVIGFADPSEAERGRYWRAQVVRAAKALDFFSNHRDGTWWCMMKLTLLGETLRYLVIIQKVGHGETGVLALSVVAEFVEPSDPEELPDGRHNVTDALEIRYADSLTFTHGEDVQQRVVELNHVLERTLALSLDALGRRLS